MSYSSKDSNFVELWEKIAETIQNNLDTEDDDRIFRVLIPNFEMLIGEGGKKEQIEVIRFMRNFKAMIRASNAVCLISVDEQLLPKHLVQNLIFLADSVLKLTSF